MKIIESLYAWYFIDPISHMASVSGEGGDVKIIPKVGGWTYNGDPDNPTFSPSIRELGRDDKTLDHFFVKDGKVEYCGDCPHAYAGQSLEIPDFPEERRGYYEEHTTYAQLLDTRTDNEPHHAAWGRCRRRHAAMAHHPRTEGNRQQRDCAAVHIGADGDGSGHAGASGCRLADADGDFGHYHRGPDRMTPGLYLCIVSLLVLLICCLAIMR